MIKKRTLLTWLTKNDIYNICKQFDLSGLSSYTKDQLIGELMSKRTIKLEAILHILKATDLKQLCNDYEIKTKSNKKADTISSILGENKNMGFLNKLFKSGSEKIPKKNSVKQATYKKYSIDKTNLLTLSFKFTDFILHIEHKHLNDIGKFAIFSLRMFRDGHSINEISQITNIDSIVIEKQLFFLIEKGYITSDYQLNNEATNVLALYDLVEMNNSVKPIVAFEHYIKNEEHKKIFSSDMLLNKTEKPAGLGLDPIIHDYKIKSIFTEMNETSKALEYLITIHTQFLDTIRNNAEEFIFTLEPTHNSYYYNQKILVKNFLNIEECSNSLIKFGIPFCKHEINFSNDGSETYDWFQINSKTLNFSYSLLNGNKIDIETVTIIDDNTDALRIPKLQESSEILNNSIQLPLKVFLSENFKRSRTTGFYLKKISDESFNKLLDG